MLHLFCILSLLVAQVLSTPRYIIGIFEQKYVYAYPIDICLSTGVLVGKQYVKYVCSADNSSVTRYNYSDNACSSTAASATVITASDVTELDINQFNCDGTNDYAITALYTNCKSSPLSYLYTAVNVCYLQDASNASRSVYTHTQCNSTSAALSTYYSTGSCDTYDAGVSLKNTTGISTTCSYYATQSGIKVYAKLTTCVYNGYSQLPVTTVYSSATSSKQVGQVNLTLILTTEECTSDPDLCGYDWGSFFQSYFDDSVIQVTSYCDSNEGVGYAGMNFEISATIYKGTSLSVSSDCSTYTDAIYSKISALYPSVTVTSSVTCSSDNTSGGFMLRVYGASTIFILFAMMMFAF